MFTTEGRVWEDVYPPPPRRGELFLVSMDPRGNSASLLWLSTIKWSRGPCFGLKDGLSELRRV